MDYEKETKELKTLTFAVGVVVAIALLIPLYVYWNY